MLQKDLCSSIKLAEVLDQAQITSTTTSAAVDALGYNSLTFGIHVPTVSTVTAGTHYFTFTVTGCATSGGSYTALDSTDYIVISSWDRLIDASGEAGAWYQLGVVPSTTGYRYFKLIATETGTADITIGAVAILGHPDSLPTT